MTVLLKRSRDSWESNNDHNYKETYAACAGTVRTQQRILQDFKIKELINELTNLGTGNAPFRLDSVSHPKEPATQK